MQACLCALPCYTRVNTRCKFCNNLPVIQALISKLMYPVKPRYTNHAKICAEVSLLSTIGVQANCWSIILVTMHRLLSGNCCDERFHCNDMVQLQTAVLPNDWHCITSDNIHCAHTFPAKCAVQNMKYDASSNIAQGLELLAAFEHSWKSAAEQTGHHPGPCSRHDFQSHNTGSVA